MSAETQSCDPFQHAWEEVYYGYECQKCGLFVPFGCEPWAPDADEVYELAVED
jgi:hypothetical protein